MNGLKFYVILNNKKQKKYTFKMILDSLIFMLFLYVFQSLFQNTKYLVGGTQGQPSVTAFLHASLLHPFEI
jgi:hypothetical protein